MKNFEEINRTFTVKKKLNELQSYLTRLRGLMLTLIILCSIGIGNAWGDTWTWTASTAADLGNSNGSVTLNGKSWTVARSSWSSTQMTDGSLQIGSKNNPSTLTLTTSAFSSYTITKVEVECASYSAYHNIAISVGGTTFLAATATSSWTTVSKKTGTGSTTGNISINFTKGSNSWRAMYIKSITVTYTAGGGCTTPTASWSSAPTNGTAGGNMNATLTTNYPAGVTYSSSNTSVATVSGDGTSTCAITYVAAGTARITASVAGDGSTYCAGPATCYTDITVSAPAASYTVTWMAGGETFATQSGSTGTALTDPGTPASETYCDGEKVFVGWTATADYTNASTPPGDLFTSVGGKTIPSGGITYYAVYAEAGAGGTTTKSYTITFNDNGTDSSTKLTTVNFKNQVTGNADSISSVSATDNCFAGNGGLKMSSAKQNGSFTLNLAHSHPITKVVLNAKRKNLTAGGNYGVTVGSTVFSTTDDYSLDFVNLEYTGTKTTTSSLTVTSTSTTSAGTSADNRVGWMTALTIYYEEAGAATYSNYSTTCVTCDNKVNISKGLEEYGTFTLSKSGLQATCNGGRVITVTPTPADHYRVASVTASNPATTGTATVTGPANNVWTVTYSENSKGNSTVNVTFEPIPTHTITLVPSAPANGTTSLESAGTTSVTLEEGIICSLWTVPDDCYSLSSITITPADGYSELEANGENKWEIIDITKDLSVAVVYAQRTQYTVTLDAGTGSVGSTSITQSNCGNITLPAASPSDACEAEGWEFAGWSRTKVNIETTSAPVLYTGSYTPTANETLYAVYKQGSGVAVSYWVKVKDESKLAAGDSVIIAASEYDLAMSTTQNTNNRGQADITKCASIGGDTLTALSAGVAKFVLTVGSTSGTWSFYDSNGYLCAASSTANQLKTKATKDANGSWNITINSSDGVASIVAQGSYTRNTMRYNASSNLFASYDPVNTMKDICLYTKAMGSTNTYFSSPSCTPCVSAAASLSSSAISMTTGKSSVITLTSANTSAVTATSSNTEVATVSVSGKNITVNGIAEGEATVIIQQVRDGVDESAHCEVYFEVSISVTTATIEIIEWEREAVTIEYDGDPEASVILGKEVEHGSKEATVAQDLFFSKYFEAAGEDKLLGIFNGTQETIDLSKYTIKDNLGSNDALISLELSEFGKTPGQIAPKEEIILYRYGTTAYSKSCMDTIDGHETWNEITWAGMKFSGRHSIGLYKKDKSNNDSIIDIIGATYYDESNPTNHTPDLVVLDKSTGSGNNGISPTWGDESGFNAESCGDNIDTKDIETNYGLSTNRCLLVRKNTVTSGLDAVTLNRLDESMPAHSNAALAAAAFQTLCTEWAGVHVPSWEDKTTATCNGMGYVAGFDYSDYYVTMETFSDDTEIGGYSNDDGTYTIPLPHLDTLACRLIRIQLAKEGNVIASSDPKVPIVVDADMSTNSEEFYRHSIDTCKVCDVVIRNNATLTKAATGATKDRSELQNITVYSGSHLVVPSGATNFRAKSIVLRSLDDTVSTASFAGGVTFKDKGYRVYHSKRVKQDRWYWISLPYACSTSKITWQDGTKATIGTDFHLKYYDGAQRAATQQGGCWKEYTGSTIQPGVGYILSVEQRVGHTYRELIFPMDTISEGETTKGVPVDDYGAGESITPNHKGWNLVGNPYMTYYQKNKINAGDKNLPALTVGKLIPHDSIDAENPLRTIHTYTIDVSGGNNAPFITVPKDHGNSEYEQKLVMDYDLPPFISYFVQIGNNTPVATQQYVNFAKADLTTSPTGLLPASYVRKRVEEEEVDPQEAVLVTLRMKNHEQEADETTFIISDQYSADYEIGSDLGKWFGDNYKDYTKPVLYSKANDGDKLVFYSLPDASAEQWIPLGFWGGNVTQPITFSLRRNNRKLDYVKSVMLHDKTQNTYTELLENDYQFAPGSQTKLNGSRFEVKVLLERPKNVPTGLGNIHEGLYAYANGSQLVVVGLPEQASVWIYDAVGHLIASEATVNYMRTYTMPAQGVYFVRVNSAAGQQTLRTIVK